MQNLEGKALVKQERRFSRKAREQSRKKLRKEKELKKHLKDMAPIIGQPKISNQSRT